MQFLTQSDPPSIAREFVRKPGADWYDSTKDTANSNDLDVANSKTESEKSTKRHSSLYVGTIGHKRLRPTAHHFSYSIFMAYIDLDEVAPLFSHSFFCSQSRWSVASFYRSDYLGDSSRPLKDSVSELVESITGSRVRGPMRMLTHLRYFGVIFNPITLYYCFEENGADLQAIVAEVTNTPWRERHAYVIPCTEMNGTTLTHRCRKEFHVSPFMEMDQHYLWQLNIPGSSIDLKIENHDHQGHLFTASLNLRRREFTPVNLAFQLSRTPVVTAKVILAIYWQALRLWFKKVPYVPHP